MDTAIRTSPDVNEHPGQSWSATQKSVTLSSGEAELVAVVKMSTDLIGITQLLADWGVSKTAKVMVDSSAALGIVRRKGNGKMRHVRVGLMWVQEKEESGELQHNKVEGENNAGDMMTKGLGEKKILQHMQGIGQEHRDGKADTGLNL